MIIEMGCIVALGLLFTFCKVSWQARMRMLSHPLAMDIGVFVLLTVLHWGTFSGVMTATTGAMICSGMLTLGRYLFGHQVRRIYYPGVFNVAHKLTTTLIKDIV